MRSLFFAQFFGIGESGEMPFKVKQGGKKHGGRYYRTGETTPARFVDADMRA
jgi:hypothetical protein